MSLFAIASISMKDLFLLSDNSVCKASLFFGTRNSVCILVFLKTFSQNILAEKMEKVSHPAFLIEEKES